MINNKRAKHLIDKNKELVAENKALKAIIKENGKIMDQVSPIITCMLLYVEAHIEDIEADINDFGDLKPVLELLKENVGE